MTSRTLLCALTLTLMACDPGGSGETSCTDGVDNDMNGQTDCADPACAAFVGCVGQPEGGVPDGGAGDGGGPACDSTNCTGCCDGDRCLSGASLAACGQGGVACDVCALGAMCEATGCVGGPVACGPGNCDGCCMGDICVTGDRPAACGMGGGACEMCESWQMCQSAGCGVDPAGEWQIELLSGVVPATPLGGGSWDGVGAGEADPFVEVRVGSAGAAGIPFPTQDNTLTPDWTEGGSTRALSPRQTAAQLLAFLRFDMFDEDVSFDDPIGRCEYTEGDVMFNGETITLVCPPDPVLDHPGFTLVWRLVPG